MAGVAREPQGGERRDSVQVMSEKADPRHPRLWSSRDWGAFLSPLSHVFFSPTPPTLSSVLASPSLAVPSLGISPSLVERRLSNCAGWSTGYMLKIMISGSAVFIVTASPSEFEMTTAFAYRSA